MVLLHRHHSLLLFLCLFSLFHHCPRVRPLVWIAAYIQTNFLRNHIVAIPPPPPPPWEPASNPVLFSDDDTVDGEIYYRGIAPIIYLIYAGVPSVKNRPVLIIRRSCADSTRSREHPWDLASLGSLLKLEVCYQAIILSL